MSRIFGKKKSNEHKLPSNKAPPPPPPGRKKNGKEADTNTNTNSDSSALAQLSPTSYAKQFDDLDHVVSAASGRSRNSQPVDLSSHMEGLRLGSTEDNAGDVLDFDEDDAVFEDDDSDDDEEPAVPPDKTPDKVVAPRTDRSRSHVRDRRRVLPEESPQRGDHGDASSSSSMGAYDNASVGTTESDEDEEGVNKSGHGSDSAEDYTEDEDEGEDGYKVGGYHPVKVGEVYNQR